MAEAGHQRPVATAFAPPPPMWRHFTAHNVQRLEAIKKQASQDENGRLQRRKWTPVELRALDLPAELRFLVPPDIPTSGQYSVFGESQNLSTALPSLKEQGIEQLYPSFPETGDPSKPTKPLNHAYYLLKISKSLLLNFLEFVGILSVSPEQFQVKLEDLRNLFINAHHLLNLYRPHQARESLILMMEEQLDRSRKEIEQMDKIKAEIECVLEQLRIEGLDAEAAMRTKSVQAQEAVDSAGASAKRARLIWELLHSEE